jgi:hypothetical protein
MKTGGQGVEDPDEEAPQDVDSERRPGETQNRAPAVDGDVEEVTEDASQSSAEEDADQFFHALAKGFEWSKVQKDSIQGEGLQSFSGNLPYLDEHMNGRFGLVVYLCNESFNFNRS